jgi:hypothetical protein
MAMVPLDFPASLRLAPTAVAVPGPRLALLVPAWKIGGEIGVLADQAMPLFPGKLARVNDRQVP